MKAIRMYAPGDLRVEDVPIPKLAPDEVLIKVHAVGVCGSDIPRANTYGAHVSPITLGHEFSGTVETCGDSVDTVAPGDHVVVVPLVPCMQCQWCHKGLYSLCESYNYYGSRCDGAMAEYVAVKKSNLLKLDKSVSFEDAATIDPCANALHALTRANFQPGDTVTVYGMGAIGMYIVQCAKAMGAGLTAAVDVWQEKLEIAKQLGADLCVNSREENPVDAVGGMTEGMGTDIVIDCTGVPAAQQSAVRTAAKRGRVVLLGISHQGLALDAHDVDMIMRGELTVTGSWNSFTAPFPGSDWFDAIKLFEAHKISSELLISHKLPLDEAPAVFGEIAGGKMYYNKILFYPHKRS